VIGSEDQAVTAEVVATLDTPFELDRPAANPEARRTTVRRSVASLLLLAFGVLFLAPMLWLVSASFDSKASWSVEWPHFTLTNFKQALAGPLLHALAKKMEVGIIDSRP